MSSVVTAPEGVPSRLSRTTHASRVSRGRLTGDFFFGAAVAIGLAVVEFVAGGGNALSPNTWVQGGLVVLAAAATVAAALFASSGRACGAATLGWFAALAALTYASIAWSVQPANSWLEANRTLSYLAVFATALLLARLAPSRWRALIGGVATAATVACAYSLLVKVFPGTLDPNDPLGRLRAPFDYWNAVGLMGALGLPACLWAGVRREPAPVLRALTVPAIAVLLAAVVLSFSRGAVLVAVIGLVVWFAFAPLRLRSALILLLGAAAAAAISAWGIAKPGVSADNMATAARVSAGHSFGVVIAVALVLSLAAGFAASLALDRVRPSAAIRRRVGYVLIGLVALIPVGGVLALAKSSRGLTGEVSHLWSRLTNTKGGAADKPGRLVDLSNSRPHYWSAAIKIGEHHPLAGVGALGFATAQTRYSSGTTLNPISGVLHAHGYVVETFADLGAIGLAISLALLVGWALATGRTFELAWPGRGPHAPRPPPATERAGLVALLAIVITFGVHSAIDWTWFIPGTAVTALACAGWLAGRGPLSRPATRLSRRRALTRSPGAVALVVTTAVLALAALWVIAQPLRSSNSYWAATAAASRGDGAAALADARSAANENPVSIDPLFLLSRLYGDLGDGSAARQELRAAADRQPANPQTWEQLGCYDFAHHRYAVGKSELGRALALEPGKPLLATNLVGFCVSISS